MKKLALQTIVVVTLLCLHIAGLSQELEPRSLTNLPEATNFIGIGYAYGFGNTLMDPALPLDDFKGTIHTTFFAYVRSVNIFGKSAKIDAILPFGGGDFQGIFDGEEFEEHFTGFGDLRVRIAINLTGAPALAQSAYSNYVQKTVSGLSIQVIIPSGEYEKDQLANLGSNRWAVRTAYGISHSFQKWILEGYAGFWLFSENDAFLGNNELSQSALWVVKAHLTRIFKKGMWLALDSGYGYGAESYINDMKRDAVVSGLRLGLTYALPLNPHHSLKFTAVSGIRFREGGDFNAFSLIYQYRWIKKSD